jgi:hypothetical protein
MSANIEARSTICSLLFAMSLFIFIFFLAYAASYGLILLCFWICILRAEKNGKSKSMVEFVALQLGKLIIPALYSYFIAEVGYRV